MPLTHVVIWDEEKGYRPISVTEASSMFPLETVNAYSGFFRCQLCGQIVGFSKAREDTGSRYFYHSRGEEDKSCEDRMSSYDIGPTTLSSHTLPLRITVNDYSFNLEIGFFMPTMRDGDSPQCERIIITGSDDSSTSYEFSFDRISNIGTTYLSVGFKPNKKYFIRYIEPNTYLKMFWPEEVLGFEPSGAIFDCKTGIMLQVGSKVYLGREYYLVTLMKPRIDPDILLLETREFTIDTYYTWRVYRVRAKCFSQKAANFFLQFSAFLTQTPNSFYPIWPVTISSPFFYYHQDLDVFFYQSEDAEDLRTYPLLEDSFMPKSETLENGKLYKIFAPQREHLLSLGGFGAKGFSYLLRKELDMQATLPVVSLTDAEGRELRLESYPQLPKGKRVLISTPFDGRAELFKEEELCHVYRLQPECPLEIGPLSPGMMICIYQGCDLVRTVTFEKKSPVVDIGKLDSALVTQLRNAKGREILIAHSIGAVARRLKEYPKTLKWLSCVLRKGTIAESAFHILVKFSQQDVGGADHGR